MRVQRPDGASLDLHVVDLGLACCAVEVMTALTLLDPAAVVPPRIQLSTSAADAPAAPRVVAATADGAGDGGSASTAGEDLWVLVVSGTISNALAPAVREAFEALPEPRAVVAFGGCAISGGPYWDSYAVTPGAAEIVPVDLVVPGCPPRPADLVDALARLPVPSHA